MPRCPHGCEASHYRWDVPPDTEEVIAWRERFPMRSAMSAAEWDKAVKVWRAQRPPGLPGERAMAT